MMIKNFLTNPKKPKKPSIVFNNVIKISKNKKISAKKGTKNYVCIKQPLITSYAKYNVCVVSHPKQIKKKNGWKNSCNDA